MKQSQKEVIIVILTFVMGLLTNVATNSLLTSWHPYLWISWIPLIICLGVIIGLPLIHERGASYPTESSSRSRMLTKVEAFWVKGVLEQSLYNIAHIELGLHYNLDAVIRPFDAIIRRPIQPDQTIPPGKRIVDIFDALGGELLILGAPGAGKTTLLLELTKDLIDRARINETLPIPIVFNLSSWTQKKLLLEEWLIDELSKRYDVPRHLSRTWIDTDGVILLLDGLDEVRQQHRLACVEAINTFRQKHGLLSVVVCSRVADYEAISMKLRLQGSIIIQPLTQQQIGKYLKRIGRPMSGVHALLQADPILFELLETPLMLSIVALTYKGKSPSILKATETLDARRRHLFNDYIEAMFSRRGNQHGYTPEQVKQWLGWLARNMIVQNQVEFYIERLHSDWLEKREQQRQYGLVEGFFQGVARAPSWAIIFSLIAVLLGSSVIFNAVVGVFMAMCRGILGRRSGAFDDLPISETVRWSLKKALWALKTNKKGVLKLSIFSTGYASGFAVLALIINRGNISLLILCLCSIVVGTYIAFAKFIVLGGLSLGEIEVKTYPNQGIWRSGRIAVFAGITISIVISLPATLGFTLFLGTDMGVMFGTLIALGFGIPGALFLGGDRCVKHLAIRLTVYKTRSFPWNIIRFLEECVDLVFLHRVGGGYIFIHRLLMDHFASLPTPQTYDANQQQAVHEVEL